MVYENVIKSSIYDQYEDGRIRIYLRFSDNTHKVISYPKYLMKCHLGRYLTEDETVDHIDQNPQNNDISNLRILSRKEHCSNDAKRCIPVILTCALCGKEFEHKGYLSKRNNKNKKCKGFYFCSRHCAGVWNQQIQAGVRKIETQEEIKSEYYTKHSFN